MKGLFVVVSMSVVVMVAACEKAADVSSPSLVTGIPATTGFLARCQGGVQSLSSTQGAITKEGGVPTIYRIPPANPDGPGCLQVSVGMAGPGVSAGLYTGLYDAEILRRCRENNDCPADRLVARGETRGDSIWIEHVSDKPSVTELFLVMYNQEPATYRGFSVVYASEPRTDVR